METFNFGPHTVRHDYPEGDRVQFGKGYVFSAAPQLPLQRTINLHFESLCWCRNGSGVIDASITPSLNILALDEFYRVHTQHVRFNYVHEVFGTMVVRFNGPFRMPAGRPGGTGWTEAFDLSLLEHP